MKIKIIKNNTRRIAVKVPDTEAQEIVRLLEQNAKLSTSQAYTAIQIIKSVYPDVGKKPKRARRTAKRTGKPLPFWGIVVGIGCVSALLFALSSLIGG